MHTFDYKFMYIRFHIEACIRTVFIYNNVQKINMRTYCIAVYKITVVKIVSNTYFD